MNNRRYIRLFLVLLATSVVVGITLAARQGSLTFDSSSLKVRPKEMFKSSSAESLWNQMTKGSKKPDQDNFPLSDFLIKKDLYRTEKLTVFSDPYIFTEQKEGDESDINEKCSKLKVEHDIFTSATKLLPAEFAEIEKQIAKSSEYSKMLKKAEARFEPKIPREKQWFRFAGSSVWLEDLNVHYMVSRLIYSPSGIANHGFASFLYVQIFDTDWNEIKDTMTFPYEQQMTQNVLNTDGSLSDMVVSSKIAYREMSFPSILPIPFNYFLHTENNKYYYGPEDPRIIKKTNTKLGFSEPIVVFNMKDMSINKRVMFMTLPFSGNFKMLMKSSVPFANIEKNWTPFLSTQQDEEHLNFVYSINPLEVVTCSIRTGMCQFLQKHKKEDVDYFGPLRGGTQLERLPLDSLPDHLKTKFVLPENRNIYVGWARTHLNKCGCGESMYRPNLIILVEDYNPDTKQLYYKMSDVSDFIDFNAEIPKWANPQIDDQGNIKEDDSISSCDKNLRNVLIPNSIAYWEVESVMNNGIQFGRKFLDKIPAEDVDSEISYNDYMGITLSAADADVKIVHVRGVLDYISKIDSLFNPKTKITSKDVFELPGKDLNQKCSEIAAKDYCVRYADMNGGVVTY
ncbi:hypothetical protein CANTEDRAFT_121442 [Yamadazyma tenuis ATCC 10573]|uniref:Uncharacterized protein n=2 Tax=Candida tenuis (strain ATCC 10573 / BCRC 21748 / CBS 615 / JCM 9827 / NBRC 10315 / NRRL Y-1498 / VKM Y-70) TaxID=590646 RepID=G3B458_CANTC|nr:uncharacterized protein CANTEDRAFT_121442 [Yamadazyma tenuis ATCC 10573]EGV63780.1 hypothetical protein CANTEDRAFT_121442 [Yamadazyma tenuis ATCC 10573]